MFVIRILSRFTTVGGEINGAGSFVYLHHLLHVPRSFGNAVLQVSFIIIQIQVCPTVTLTPLDKFLASVEYLNRTSFLVGIHPFLHNRYDGILTDRIGTDIDAMQVTAAAGYIETVIVSLPDSGHQLLVALLLFPRTVRQIQRLVLPGSRTDFFPCVGSHVKQVKMVFRSLHLTRHLILIGFQRRARFGDGVDDPKRLDSPVVRNDGYEILRIGRPATPHTPALAVAQGIGIQDAVRNSVTEIGSTVSSQLCLDNGTVLLVLLCLAVILDTHAIQVAVLGIDHTLSVRRYRCPAQPFRLFLRILQVRQFAGLGIVRKIEHFLFLLVLLLIIVFLRFGIATGSHFESKGTSVFLYFQVGDRQMTGLKRVLHDFGQLGSQFIAVKKRSLAAGSRVYHIPELPFTRLVFKPETGALLKPVRVYGGRKQHVLQLGPCKLLGLQVFRQSLLCLSRHGL